MEMSSIHKWTSEALADYAVALPVRSCSRDAGRGI